MMHEQALSQSPRPPRTTPAMVAGVSKRLWEMSDIVNVLETWEAAQARG